MDGSGKVSAREAHNYANAIHDPYDTPVYNESSVTAGNRHLGQRYLYIWPVYCRLLVEILQPHYLRRPGPDFYEILHGKLVPELQAIEAKLTDVSAGQEAELRKELTKVAKAVMQ